MFRPLARLLISAALVLSLGLHWAVLQSAAWAGMLVKYSVEQGSLLTGLSQTFDARHPCTLCGAVQQATQQEKNASQDSAPPQPDNGKKLTLALPEISLVLPVAPARETPPHFSGPMRAVHRATRPPLPPPRAGILSPLLG